MSSTQTTPRPATAATTPLSRMTALARAELTLLGRTRGALVAALFVPLVMPVTVRSAAEEMDLAGAGLSTGTLVLPAAVGFSLLFAVYSVLVGVFVVRREELVLKRLRTGEVTDREILAANALPAVALALLQVVLLVAAGAVAFDLSAPQRPEIFLAGLLVGLVMMSGLAAATSAVTRTVQTSQLTTLPLFFVSLFASGIFVPLDIFPDGLASVFELLPLTGVMTLVRHGWLGGVEGGDLLTATVAALAWTGFAVFAVQRWFRWDPRG